MAKPSYLSTGPGYDIVPITPSDSATINPCKAFYIVGAGNLCFRTLSGNTRTVPVPANFVLAVGGDMVMLTNTTATGIWGIPL